MLHLIKPTSGSVRPRKRVARGSSAGGGTTAGRGTKGQQSRTGRKHAKVGFEGGQTPLLRRMPKAGGFLNVSRVNYEPLNIGTIDTQLDAGSYSIKDLHSRGLLTKNCPTKLLGGGTLKKAVTVEVHAASKSARKAIEAAGGKVTIVPWSKS